MTHQVERSHIVEWLSEHRGRVVGPEYSRQFVEYLWSTQPWMGTSVDFDVVPNLRLHLDDPALQERVQASPLGQHPFMFVVYGPDEPGVVCPLADGITDIDVLSWTNPGELYVCGAGVFDGQVLLAPGDFAEYDGMEHLSIRLEGPATKRET